MSIWERFSAEQRKEYIQFLQVYGALSNLFRQKQGSKTPYLDSKFQETVFAKIFNCKNTDIGNTPHDVKVQFGDEIIGIGLKTWMESKPSFQKVMQIKSHQRIIKSSHELGAEALAHKISEIKNESLIRDYKRLGLSEDKNIYHYVTREAGHFIINECAYPLVDTNNLSNFDLKSTSFNWSDGKKDYKFTFGDSQIHQKFDSSKKDTLILDRFDVKIIEDPFTFLLDAYLNIIGTAKEVKEDTVEVYLPLYSYRTKEVEDKSGLNAWNAAPKSKGSDTLRPLNEVYIPIPIEFHKKYPDFFIKDILGVIKIRNNYDGDKENKPEVRFHLKLPNGKVLPSLLTQSNLKGLESGSNTEHDEHGKRYGQSALGQWLLVDVLGLNERKLVTREWLQMRGTDSVRLWRKKDDYSIIYMDFAPIGAFEAFMNNEPIPEGDE